MRPLIARCGLQAPLQPAAPASTTPIAMDAAEMAKYAGSYTNPPARVDLAVRDGKLYFRRGSAQTFALVPGPDGTIAFLHTGSRAFKRPTGAS